LEYGSTFIPIPLEEVAKNIQEAYRASGGSPDMWKKYLEAAAWGSFSGGTGIRTYENNDKKGSSD